MSNVFLVTSLKSAYKKLMLLQGAMYLSYVFCWHSTPKYTTLNSSEGCNSEAVFQNDYADSNNTSEFQQLTLYVNCFPVIHSNLSDLLHSHLCLISFVLLQS